VNNGLLVKKWSSRIRRRVVCKYQHSCQTVVPIWNHTTSWSRTQ